MTNRTGLPIPTLGYPSQSAAISALYMQGIPIPDIIFLTGSSVNSAYRTIAGVKKKNGIARQPLRKQAVPEAKQKAPSLGAANGDVWAMSDNDRRKAFHARAVKAAAALRKQAAKQDGQA